MRQSFANKLSLCIYKIKVDVLKMKSSRLEIDEMVVGSFKVDDKDKRLRFFEKTFRSADININVAFKIFSLILSNIEINFHK